MTQELVKASDRSRSFNNGVQLVWDSTSLSTVETCSRKYYYSMVWGIGPQSTSVHLIFGGIYASGLELYYKLRAKPMSHDEAQLEVVRHAMTESWDYENNRPVLFESSAKNRQTLVRTLVWYLEEFGDEKESGIKTYHKLDGVPAVELSFKIPINDSLVLSGHMDRVVDYAGALYGMDQKTTGTTVTEYFFKQFKPNTQMSLYIFAGQVVLKEPMQGMIIDAAQIAVGFSRFSRGFTYRTVEELDEWYDATIGRINYTQHQSESASSKDFIEGARYFPQNPASCGNYGGCPFRSLCATTPRLREKVARSEYATKLWDPAVER